MKTIILYESKTGFTKGCAEQLFQNVENAEMKEISEEVNLKEYDVILIGAPIYKGKIDKKVKKYFKTHKTTLMKRRLGIFCAGMNQSEFNSAVQDSLHPDIFYHARIVHCGGRINYERLSVIEKLTVKRRLGVTESQEINKTEEMKEFIDWVIK